MTKDTPRVWLRRALMITLVAMGAIIGFSTVAHAGTNESITVKGGRAVFQHRGEILTAKDSRRDGRCVTADLRYNIGGPNDALAYEDVTACGRGKVARVNLLIPNTRDVQLRVCYTGGGRADKCSGWQWAQA